MEFCAEVHQEDAVKLPIKELCELQFYKFDPSIKQVDEIQRSIYISDVPLHMQPTPIKMAVIHALGIQESDITKFKLTTPYNAIWQRAHMAFKTHDIAKQFEKIFSISVMGNCLRVSPAYYSKQLNDTRNCHRLIIGGLPTNKELKAIDRKSVV